MSDDPSAKWKTEIDRYAKICKQVLAISPHIRYAGAVNRYGRTLTGFLRPGATPMLGREQTKNEFFILSAIMNMRTETEEAIGNLEHILIRHEKVKVALIPTEKAWFYISIEREEEKYMNVVSEAKRVISG